MTDPKLVKLLQDYHKLHAAVQRIGRLITPGLVECDRCGEWFLQNTAEGYMRHCTTCLPHNGRPDGRKARMYARWAAQVWLYKVEVRDRMERDGWCANETWGWLCRWNEDDTSFVDLVRQCLR